MENVLIFGITDLAEVLIYHLERCEEYNVAAVTADRRYIIKNKMGILFGRYPIISFEEIDDIYPPDVYSFFVCIGYSRMNEGRKQAFKKIKEKGYEILSYIHQTALVQTETIGEGNLLFENVTVGAYCTIGDGNIFYPCSHVAHHTKIGDFNFMAISCSVAGHVSVGSQCIFGNNCTTKNGITVADRTLIGAGAYIACSSNESDVIVPVRSEILKKKSYEIKI